MRRPLLGRPAEVAALHESIQRSPAEPAPQLVNREKAIRSIVRGEEKARSAIRQSPPWSSEETASLSRIPRLLLLRRRESGQVAKPDTNRVAHRFRRGPATPSSSQADASACAHQSYPPAGTETESRHRRPSVELPGDNLPPVL